MRTSACGEHPAPARPESRTDADAGPPVAPSHGTLTPLRLDEVRLTSGFWADRQRINRENTLAHCEQWMERLGWIANFDATAEALAHGTRGEHRGANFADSEIYKLLEAMAWEAHRGDDPETDRRFTALVERVAAAQHPDGYLNTCYGRPGRPERYSDLAWGHELYCAGHLIQAAVARARTRGADEPLVTVARRVADHLYAEFGPDGRDAVCGHPEIETALVELYRVTGEERHLTLAGLFVDRRGTGTLPPIQFGAAYFQDDIPVRDATVLRGHAVRALYLSAGAVDVGVETDDRSLLDAVETQWDTTVARRTYLTGGMGSHHLDESFGADYALPPDRAYSETCAGIASVMLSWRLLLATGRTRYADLIERTLFNVVATSPRADGRAFFYANTLHQRTEGRVPAEDEVSTSAGASLRPPWYGVSCCPTNVARTLASIAGYVATRDAEGVQIHQYTPCDIRTTLDDGTVIDLKVDTSYPRGRCIAIRVRTAGRFALTLRVPHWAQGKAVLDDGGTRRHLDEATVTVRREFAEGETLRLDLDLTPRFTTVDDQIDAVRGCVAVESGPLVLCAESVDLPDDLDLEDLRVDFSVAPRPHPEGASIRIRPRAEPVAWSDRWGPYGSPMYRHDAAARPDMAAPDGGKAAGRTAEDDGGDQTSEAAADARWILLRPYHRWAHRGPSTMRVWLPVR
ncbi:hypothetical protein FHR81_001760 [Actinoalloteichus hoggarensis]|uniref:Non-reducing end beta-L-arabinofuranosidase n=1 Tax=Actinoalloteichus hoggarensis TaxID=1470176 RepID=A0A221W4H7_9PSEU|nr:beta-L-arabinofuranosidase domain-containing protein [Actinoalloteichus hoggarensis]ASO20792.1 Non-reducing end beta-L-arabinofuranosidase [Actinoalloteichus hoggarensis]MBB5920722.1 hypothetical protein [Actinoalloteichus hoggarensis]